MATHNGDDASDSPSDEDYTPNAPPTAPTTNPAEVASDASSSSASESSANPTSPSSRPRKRKRKAKPATNTVQELDLNNSGDEAVISRSLAKRRKANSKRPANGADADAADGDDSGGEGGLVKTRAQRRAEKSERKKVNLGASSVDVGALWAAMAGGAGTKKEECDGDTEVVKVDAGTNGLTPAMTAEGNVADSAKTQEPAPAAQNAAVPPAAADEDTITITRTYTFAGATTHETKTVPRHSAEARAYLSSLPASTATTSASNPNKSNLRRPKKRTSLFTAAADTAAPRRLNTLEKSKLDWAEHVDAEGIGDELDAAARGRGDYLGRMEFLGRVEGKRDALGRGS